MEKRVFVVAFLVVLLISLVSAMTINVTSPEINGVYPSNPVSISASSDEAVNWTLYVDGSPWHEVTNTNTLNYNISHPTKDVTHTLIISASNSSTQVNNTILFYVDTLSPSITSQTPGNNSNVSKGSVTFSVIYTEANLNYTKLYWKNDGSSYTTEDVSGCESGTGKSCSKSINLSSLSYGTNISYFFSLTDLFSRNKNYSSIYTFSLICTPSWGNCTDWSACSGSTKTRTCTDLNCGTGSRTESESCSSCTPSCSGKECGSDSCGGSCGTCGDGKICDDSQNCVSDSTTDTNTQTNTSTNIQNINYFLSESQFGNGSLRTLKLVGDKITFKIKNESHILELKKIYSDKVSIKISSVEQYANLSLNEVKKFDLTGDRYYDVSVILKRLNSSEADILINATNEKVPETAATTVSINVDNTTTTTETNNTGEIVNETGIVSFGSRITGGFLDAFENMKKMPVYFIIVFFVIIAGLMGTTIFMIRRKKKKKRWGRK